MQLIDHIRLTEQRHDARTESEAAENKDDLLP
jgi:hypothetical protein